jgi:hypothetical protein
MELFGSFARITYDPDGIALVLLDYNDDLWEPLAINGDQMVQVQGFVRAAGIKAFARGNEKTSLNFMKCNIETSVVEGFARLLSDIVALPKSTADILISLEDGRNWRIPDAAIQSWPASQEARLTRQTVEIIGGKIAGDAGVYIPGQTWGEINYQWENLG